ncbi:hypothetical protein BX616_008563, partial [Lobosporangium transversale]
MAFDDIQGYQQGTFEQPTDGFSSLRTLSNSDFDLESLFPGLGMTLDPLSEGSDQFIAKVILENDGKAIQPPPSVKNPLSSSHSTSQAEATQGDLVEQWLNYSITFSKLQGIPPTFTWNGRDYLACIISPTVIPLISTNALRHIHKICGELPIQLLPNEHAVALPSYVAMFPVNCRYSVVLVMVSGPMRLVSSKAYSGDREPHFRSSTVYCSNDALLYDPKLFAEYTRSATSTPSSVILHVKNTQQLIQMGLTADKTSHGYQQSQMRCMKKRLMDTNRDIQELSFNIELLQERERILQMLNREQASYRMLYRCISKKTVADFENTSPTCDGIELSIKKHRLLMAKKEALELHQSLESMKERCNSWLYSTMSAPGLEQGGRGATATDMAISPASQPAPPPGVRPFSFQALCDVRSYIRCIGTSHSEPSSSPTDLYNGDASDNVPLLLDYKCSQTSTLLEQFKPIILLKRYKCWVQRQEEQKLHRLYDSSRMDLEDLLLLEAESDFVCTRQLDMDTSSYLCSKHGLSQLRVTDRETTPLNQAHGSAESSSNTCMANPVEYSFKDKNQQEFTLPDPITDPEAFRQVEEPAMHLPNILAWATSNAGAFFLQDNNPIPFDLQQIDLDFVIEESLSVEKDPAETALRCGLLRDVWSQLDRSQQKSLMLRLVRILSTIWDNFECLGEGQGRSRVSNYVYDTLCPVTSSSLTQLTHIPERASTDTPLKKSVTIDMEDEEEQSRRNTPIPAYPFTQMTAERRLCKMEKAFSNRLFIDAFKEATQKNVHSALLPGNIRSAMQDSGLTYDQGSCSSGIQTSIICQKDQGEHEGLSQSQFLHLDNQISPQYMTTTRAQVQESVKVQRGASSRSLKPLPDVETLYRDAREHSWIRRFDFSLDDLIIQFEMPSLGDECGEPSQRNYTAPKVIGVSRWKTFCPIPVRSAPSFGGNTTDSGFATSVEAGVESVPRSSNVYQVMARSSNYPLMHLLSLPDTFCPEKFGGRDKRHGEADSSEGSNDHNYSLAYAFTRLLAHSNPQASEFLTLPLHDKELVMYHRWMAAWHEHSAQILSKAIRTRFEAMRALKKFKAQSAGAFAIDHEFGWRFRPSQLRSGGLMDVQSCPKCQDEIQEREMALEDQEWFEETVHFMEMVSEAQEGEKNDRCKGCALTDNDNEFTTPLGLNQQEIHLIHLLHKQADDKLVSCRLSSRGGNMERCKIHSEVQSFVLSEEERAL